MFKEYKIVKLSIGILILVLTLLIWNKDIENNSIFFTDRISYSVDDEVICKSSDCDEIDIESINHEFSFNGSINNLQLSQLKSDLYVVNNEYPLVLKTSKPTPVNIVFPYINNMLYNQKDGSLLVDSKSDTITLMNPSSLNEVDVNLFNIISELKFEYGVISDYDMNATGNWQNSELLIIYGKTKFYSELMMNNLQTFVKGGGNLLIISSNTAEYCVNLDVKNSCLIKERDSSKNLFNPQPKLPFKESYGGVALSDKFEVFDKSSVDLSIYSEGWSNFVTNNSEGSFTPIGQINIDGELNDYAQCGVFKYFEKTSGEIFFLGSESFLYNVNYSQEDVKNFMKSVFTSALQNN